MKVFLSYSYRIENEPLVEEVLVNFLEALGFMAVYARKKPKSSEPPGIRNKELIDECQILIGLLTKDIRETKNGKEIFHPEPDVIDEVSYAEGHGLKVITLVESGTTVPTNIQTRCTYVILTREDKSKLLIDLTSRLKEMATVILKSLPHKLDDITAYYFSPYDRLLVKGNKAYFMYSFADWLVQSGYVKTENVPGDYTYWARAQGLSIINRDPTLEDLDLIILPRSLLRQYLFWLYEKDR